MIRLEGKIVISFKNPPKLQPNLLLIEIFLNPQITDEALESHVVPLIF